MPNENDLLKLKFTDQFKQDIKRLAKKYRPEKFNNVGFRISTQPTIQLSIYYQL